MPNDLRVSLGYAREGVGLPSRVLLLQCAVPTSVNLGTILCFEAGYFREHLLLWYGRPSPFTGCDNLWNGYVLQQITGHMRSSGICGVYGQEAR